MSGVTRAALWLGLGFLYAPILVLVAYSFNASALVTVWGGFSTRWYAALFSDAPLIAAAWVSLRVAVLASLIATASGRSPPSPWSGTGAFAGARCSRASSTGRW